MITPLNRYLVHARGCENQLVQRDVLASDETDARAVFVATTDESCVIDDVEAYDSNCPECESAISADVMADDGTVLYGTCECPFQPCWVCHERGTWEPSGHLPTAAELVAWILDNSVGWDAVRGGARWAIVPVGAKFGMVSDRDGEVRWFEDDASAFAAMPDENDVEDEDEDEDDVEDEGVDKDDCCIVCGFPANGSFGHGGCDAPCHTQDRSEWYRPDDEDEDA